MVIFTADLMSVMIGKVGIQVNFTCTTFILFSVVSFSAKVCIMSLLGIIRNRL